MSGASGSSRPCRWSPRSRRRPRRLRPRRRRASPGAAARSVAVARRTGSEVNRRVLQPGLGAKSSLVITSRHGARGRPRGAAEKTNPSSLEEPMSGNGHHQTPEQIRKSLSHPVIDGDGHWVEFDPVFSERMRKVGGDKAADGWLAALKTTDDALTLSLSERRPP